MKAIYKPILFIFLMCISINSVANCSESIYGIVIAKSGLRLRDEPSVNSKIITTIKSGEHVLIIRENVKSETISGHTGSWIYVEYLGKQGWVFDAYIYKEYYYGRIDTNELCIAGLKIGDNKKKLVTILGDPLKKFISGHGEDDAGSYNIITYQYKKIRLEIVRNEIDMIIIDKEGFRTKSGIQVGIKKNQLIKIVGRIPDSSFYNFPIIKLSGSDMTSYLSLFFSKDNILKKIIIEGDRP